MTYSGSRGQEVPVSIFRVSPSGRRESFVSGIVNPTSMTFDARGNLYVSSRFEGSVYRVKPDGTHEAIASDLGIACGLAFGRDGMLYVGDRSGTIFGMKADGTTLTKFRRGPGPHTGVHLIYVRDDLSTIVHHHPPVPGLPVLRRRDTLHGHCVPDNRRTAAGHGRPRWRSSRPDRPGRAP